MMRVLARLGYVFLTLGFLLGVLIELIGLGIIAWNLWVDGRSVLASMSNDAWIPVLRWLLVQGVIYCVATLLAGVVVFVAMLICYVLGGFSKSEPDDVGALIGGIIFYWVATLVAFVVFLVAMAML